MNTSKILLLLVLSLSTQDAAFASLTRTASFGTQPVFSSNLGALPGTVHTSVASGALWYDDDYNIFYNPSYINEYKDFATLQKGGETGFVKSFMETFAFGVFVGRGGTGSSIYSKSGIYTNGAQRQYAPGLIAPGIRETNGTGDQGYYTGDTNGAGISTRLPLDLFIGGDYGVRWGVKVTTAQNPWFKNPDGKKAKYWNITGGIQFLGFEPFVGMTTAALSDGRRVAPMGTEALTETVLGFRFRYEGWSPYFVYKYHEQEGTPLASPNHLSTRMNIVGFGLGHSNEIIPKLTLYKHIGLYMIAVSDSDHFLPNAVFPSIYRSYNQTTLPVNLALEDAVNEWLTLRAGVGYNLINVADYDKDVGEARTAKANLKSMPEVRFGSTIKYMEYGFDLTLGTGNAVRNGKNVTENTGLNNEFFAMAGLTYKWLAY